KRNLSTFTNIFSMIPLGCLTDLSASWIVNLVGFGSPNPSFLNMEYGITLILAPKSANALSIDKLPRVQGMVKHLGSLSLGGSLRWRMAEHSSLRVTDLSSSSFLLLLIMSFKYLTYLGIFSRASTKGMLTCNSLNNSRNLSCCALTLFCVSAWGYGILGLYSFI